MLKCDNFSEMRDPLRDCVRATMHDGSGAAVLDGQRAGVHHCPGEHFGLFLGWAAKTISQQ